MVIDYNRSALLEIDVQNDFCPSYTGKDGLVHPEGALAVKNGDGIISSLNYAAQKIASRGGLVVATQDWHPPSHVSFASAHAGKKVYDTVTMSLPPPRHWGRRRNDTPIAPLPDTIEQVLWPDHCVQGSAGAALHGRLDRTPIRFILRKGASLELDSYSAFFENDKKTSTGLEGLLRHLGIETVFIGGLATDYCVLYSAIDAAHLNFKPIVLSNAVEGVDVPSGSIERATELMRNSKVAFMSTEDI